MPTVEYSKKTAIVYYSWSGTTGSFANKLAHDSDADLYRIKDRKRPDLLSALFKGCADARNRMPIEAENALPDLWAYEKIIFCCPIWAGYPAPAFNNMIAALPSGKAVELYFISASGSSRKSEEGTKALISSKNCEIAAYQDIFSADVDVRYKLKKF
ncbi:MAG: hypothetical protein GX897_03685 [Clostridiales bacterium]|nr:hypothetical protein [Clostridiales bacterium]